MDAIKKQASKLREQVARQQQAVLRQFSGRFAVDSSLLDEPDAESHRQVRLLSKSTKRAKHFQKDVLRRLHGVIAVSSKQMEIESKIADGCIKYGEHEVCDELLGRASLKFGNSRRSIEAEMEKLQKILGGQVCVPLRTMVTSAPLEDARHLAHCYEKLKQDVEAQAADVARRQMRLKQGGDHPHSMAKLQDSEHRLSDLRSSLKSLGRETISAMKLVSADQRRITFQQLILMVDAERSYHHNVASILDQLHDEMILEREKAESEGQTASHSLVSIEDHKEIVERDGHSSHRPENHATDILHKEKKAKVDPKKSNNVEEDLANRTREESSNLRGGVAAATQIRAAEELCTTGRTPSIVESEEDDDAIVHGQSLSTERLDEKEEFFIAEVIHPFDAQESGELSLSMGNFVVVRQASESGWLEGECMGKAGWFPAAYVERRDRAPANEIMQPDSSILIQSPPPLLSSSSSSPSSSSSYQQFHLGQ